MKRTIALVLTFCLLFGLGGCANNQYTTSDPEASENLNDPKLAGMELSLPDGMVYVTAQKPLDDRLWVGGIGQDGVLLGYIGVDGESGLLDFPESFEFIYSMCEVDGNMAVLCGSMPAAYNDANGTLIVNDQAKGVLALLVFSESGVLLTQTPLEQIYREMGMIFKLMLETDGFFLLQCQNMLLKIGSDGKELGRIVLQEDNALLTALKDGITMQDRKYELTQADAQKLWELVNDTTLLSGSDLAVLTIITEEADAYFSGVRTAEETAVLIQNRTALYLAEQS